MYHRITSMYINFQQIWVSRSVKTVQIIASCINLQQPIVIFKKSHISDKYHRITYMYINFLQIRVCMSVKTLYTDIFANRFKLHKSAVTNSNFEKSHILDLYHRITYMYITFQEIRVSRSVKTVHTNIFANNRKLHKFVTTTTNFEKIYILSNMHRCITYILSIFSKFELVDQSKIVLTNYTCK